MYSVQELARMYNCTRQTIYSKMDNPDIQTYVIKCDKGLRLMPEGLNILNVIMSESKVNKIQQETYKKLDIGHTMQNPIQSIDINRYIDALREQIDCLKVDKERLYLQLEQQSKIFLLASGETSKKDDEIESLRDTLQQALEKISELEKNNKKSWWTRLFKY